MKYTEGAFKEWGYQVAREEFPDYTITEEDLKKSGANAPPQSKVLVNDRIADSMFQQILTRPREYSVIATSNLNGDYLSDAAAAQVGGLGMAPGANIGDKGAVFEATHGSAPKYAGLNKVNPTALILSGVLLLRHIDNMAEADRLEKAIAAVIAEGKDVTYDMKDDRNDPTAIGTQEMADAIIRKMQSL